MSPLTLSGPTFIVNCTQTTRCLQQKKKKKKKEEEKEEEETCVIFFRYLIFEETILVAIGIDGEPALSSANDQSSEFERHKRKGGPDLRNNEPCVGCLAYQIHPVILQRNKTNVFCDFECSTTTTNSKTPYLHRHVHRFDDESTMFVGRDHQKFG
jgi:hypothetical protein